MLAPTLSLSAYPTRRQHGLCGWCIPNAYQHSPSICNYDNPRQHTCTLHVPLLQQHSCNVPQPIPSQLLYICNCHTPNPLPSVVLQEYSHFRIGCKTVGFKHSAWQSIGPMKFIYIRTKPTSRNSIGPCDYHMNCWTCLQFATNPYTYDCMHMLGTLFKLLGNVSTNYRLQYGSIHAGSNLSQQQ